MINSTSNTKTLPRTTTGLGHPPPTGCLHWIFKPSLGNDSRIPVSSQFPSRLGPRNCGQSVARAARAPRRIPATAAGSALQKRVAKAGCIVVRIKQRTTMHSRRKQTWSNRVPASLPGMIKSGSGNAPVSRWARNADPKLAAVLRWEGRHVRVPGL